MDWIAIVVILVVALGASLLTLFSGFGLGTLLLPAFALVFPLDVAVAATAIVHLANNIWKGGLLGKHAHMRSVALFGLPAMAAAFGGAYVLVRLQSEPIAAWRFGEVTPLGLVVGGLIVLFALFDLVPRLKRWNVQARPGHLVAGGLASGFFGGLSGHQGALRSVFLTKLGLSPTAFVATGTLCAIMVDVARLAVYSATTLPGNFGAIGAGGGWSLLAAAVVMAFAGAVVGKRLLGKTTMEGIRTLVGAMLLVVGSLIAAGVV